MKRFCTNCGNEIAAATAFCDNCGTPTGNVTVAESTGTSPQLNASVGPGPKQRSGRSGRLLLITGGATIAIAIAIGGVWLGGGFADFLLLLVLLSPVIAGGFIAFAENESAVSVVDRLNDWFAAKDLALANRGGFWRKYLARSVIWSFKKLGDWPQSMQDRYWKAGLRVVSCGYLGFILLFVAAVIVYAAVVVAITIAIIVFVVFALLEGSRSQSSSGSWSSARRTDDNADESPDIRMSAGAHGGSRLYDTSDLLDKQVGRMDEDGRVYNTTGLVDRQVQLVGEDGRVFDTTGLLDKQIARVDKDGRIYDTTGLVDKQVGRVNQDGRVYDTTGLVDKQVGRVEKQDKPT